VTEDEATARVREMLAKMFDLEPTTLHADARLVDDLDLDSIDAIDMVARLHELTGRRVPDQDLRSIRTVGDVVRLVTTSSAA
jgi:acyl carrier protein